MYTTIRFDAGHNRNGNPRRVYVTLKEGHIVATYDDGYRGNAAIKDAAHRAAYDGLTFATTPKEYHELINWKE